MHVSNPVAILILGLSLTACGKNEQAAVTPAPAAAPAQPAAPSASTPDAQTALAAAGESKYKTVCAVCHGQNAEGMGNYPRLAGLTREEIGNKLMDYRAGKQMGPLTAIMAASARDLTDAEIEALAAYIGNLGK